MNSAEPKFNLGQIVITQGALAALKDSNESALPFLQRHASGDWGDICEEDKKLNDEAIAHEGDLDRQQRVLSAYVTAKNEKIWIITEWDRSVTTILLPDEY
jgi:hypothetical protein